MKYQSIQLSRRRWSRAALIVLMLFGFQGVLHARNGHLEDSKAGHAFVNAGLGHYLIDISNERFAFSGASVNGGYWVADGIAAEASLGFAFGDDRSRGFKLGLNSLLSLGVRLESPRARRTSAYVYLGGTLASLPTRFQTIANSSDTSNLQGYQLRFGLTQSLRRIPATLDMGVAAHRFDSDVSIVNFYAGLRYRFTGRRL